MEPEIESSSPWTFALLLLLSFTWALIASLCQAMHSGCTVMASYHAASALLIGPAKTLRRLQVTTWIRELSTPRLCTPQCGQTSRVPSAHRLRETSSFPLLTSYIAWSYVVNRATTAELVQGLCEGHHHRTSKALASVKLHPRLHANFRLAVAYREDPQMTSVVPFQAPKILLHFWSCQGILQLTVRGVDIVHGYAVV